MRFFTLNLSVSLVMSSLVSVKFGVISVSGFMLCWLLFNVGVNGCLRCFVKIRFNCIMCKYVFKCCG